MIRIIAAPTTSLESLCVARLRACQERSSGLFARRIRNGHWAMLRPVEAAAASAACLIGLDRAGIPPRGLVGDPGRYCAGLAAACRGPDALGGLGLVLWAGSALRAASPLALLAKAGLDPAGLVDAVPGLATAQLGWLASGLLHADHAGLRPACEAALRALEGRLAPEIGVLHHASARPTRRAWLRRRIGSFPDQAHGLQALAFAATVLGGNGWRALADAVGARMVANQGPLGQWWWLHDATTGAVAGRYPVLVPQQDSLAPAALRALALAGGQDHAAAAARGRRWLEVNELGLDLLDLDPASVARDHWRGVGRQETALARRLRQGRALLGWPGSDEAGRLRLAPLREMRPEDWGWLLYARALEQGPAPGNHIA